MTTYKNRLPAFGALGYISPAPHKTGAGILNPQANKAHNRASGFFTCKASSHLFRIMVGRMGPLTGGPVSLFAGVENPVRLTTLEILNSGGELSQLTKQGYPSWPTANNAVPALTLSASTPRPKSTAVSSAPIIWRSSCRPICYASHAARCRYGCRQFWTTSPTISATFSDCLTSPHTPGKNTNRLPLLFAAGGLRTPVVREILL
ncbi:ash family protein [Salmonella enterica]|nr:ash family protein [Salmonella enterica]EJS4494880.1 ash family protein [Salmonella enterica]